MPVIRNLGQPQNVKSVEDSQENIKLLHCIFIKYLSLVMTNHRIYIFVSVSFKQSVSLCTEYMKYHIVSLTFTAKRRLNSMVNRHILWISLKKHMVCTFDIAEVGFCCYYSVETYKIKSITNILWYINNRKYLVTNQYLIIISNLLSLRCLGPLMNHLPLYDGPRLGLYFYLADGVKVWYGVEVFLIDFLPLFVFNTYTKFYLLFFLSN